MITTPSRRPVNRGVPVGKVPAEGGTGEIRAYNLTDDQPADQPFAKGFLVIDDHTPGSGER